MAGEKLKIRIAKEKDIPQILAMIKELAEFEKLLDNVKTTEQNLKDAIFGKEKFVNVLIAEIDGKICGQTIFFKNFSTFAGKPGYYIEDLYVKPEFRGKGIGKKLLNSVVKKARKNNFGRVEWVVLNWNKTAIDFYKNRGASPLNEWIIFRLEENNF
jgi:GNAT superfamily N-acetyltransferase